MRCLETTSTNKHIILTIYLNMQKKSSVQYATKSQNIKIKKLKLPSEFDDISEYYRYMKPRGFADPDIVEMWNEFWSNLNDR